MLRVILGQSTALVNKDEGNAPRGSSDDVAQRRTRLKQENFSAQQLLEAFLHAARFTMMQYPSITVATCVCPCGTAPARQARA